MDLHQQINVMKCWIDEDEHSRLLDHITNDPEIQVKAQEFGLSIPELLALRHYTGEGHAINEAFNGLGRMSPAQLEIEEQAAIVLSQALDKLPAFKDTVVYSRQNLPTSVVNDVYQYLDIKFPVFLSTNIGFDLKTNRRFRLIIASETGKRVTWVSQHSDTEDEVLFNQGVSFSVDKLETFEDNVDIPVGHLWVYLSEEKSDVSHSS
jgi:hypothetical protein